MTVVGQLGQRRAAGRRAAPSGPASASGRRAAARRSPSHSHSTSSRSNSCPVDAADVERRSRPCGRRRPRPRRSRCAAAATRRPARRAPRARRRPAAPPPSTARRRPCGRRSTGSSARRQLGDARAELVDRAGDVERRAAVAQQPQHARSAIRRQSRNSSSWTSSWTAARARRSRPTGRRSRRCRGPRPTPGSCRPPRAGLLGHPVVERDAGQVDHLVDELGGDDLPAQRMARGSRRRSARAAPAGSSRTSRRSSSRVVGQVGLARSRRRWRSSCRRAARRTRALQTLRPRLALGDLLVASAGTRGRGRASPRPRACRGSGRAR